MARFWRTRKTDDEGSALVFVVGAMLVLMMLSMSALAYTVQSTAPTVGTAGPSASPASFPAGGYPPRHKAETFSLRECPGPGAWGPSRASHGPCRPGARWHGEC